jgi:hypothetical protein
VSEDRADAILRLGRFRLELASQVKSQSATIQDGAGRGGGSTTEWTNALRSLATPSDAETTLACIPNQRFA